MPSLEYTLSKGLISKKSGGSEINLQGVITNTRKKVTALGDAAALQSPTKADSGREYLIPAQSQGSTITLPNFAGRKTSGKIHLNGANAGILTVGDKFSFNNVFGRTFVLTAVADAGGAANGVLQADGSFGLEIGAAPNAAQAIDHLNNTLTGVGGNNVLTAMSDVTFTQTDVGVSLTIEANSVGVSNNGTITMPTFTNTPTVTGFNDGVDTRDADASGVELRYMMSGIAGNDIDIILPVANANTKGTFDATFVGGTVATNGHTPFASDDTKVTFAAAAVAGDYMILRYDGTSVWAVTGASAADAGITSA
jgi:hypothetical protein